MVRWLTTESQVERSGLKLRAYEVKNIELRLGVRVQGIRNISAAQSTFDCDFRLYFEYDLPASARSLLPLSPSVSL